ncbi:MAG: ATP-dependent RecD-like DNA helicase, partial [Ruminococcus sp.]|nr:ATP-dependent RecD-like DNA helicase [Ruminococcus sp.]
MEQELQRIEGTVENIVFRNEDNGYTVFDFNSGGEWVTVVGELGDVQEGERLIIQGNYTTHSRFGTQFKAEIYEKKLPDTTVNIEKYLASGAIKGIGVKLAEKIVKHFGEKTLEILETEPHRLTEIKGISPKRCTAIILETKKAFALRNLSTFLKKYGVQSAVVMKIYIEYGTEAFDLISKNPYILCENNIGLEFKKADKIADSLDCMEEICYPRIVAFIRDELRRNAENNGHSCMPLKYILNKVSAELKIYSDDEIL